MAREMKITEGRVKERGKTGSRTSSLLFDIMYVQCHVFTFIELQQGV